MVSLAQIVLIILPPVFSLLFVVLVTTDTCDM